MDFNDTAESQPASLAFSVEEVTGREHTQVIHGFSEQRLKVAAVECEQHVGADEGGAENGFVLRHVEDERPVEVSSLFFDDAPLTPMHKSREKMLRIWSIFAPALRKD